MAGAKKQRSPLKLGNTVKVTNTCTLERAGRIQKHGVRQLAAQHTFSRTEYCQPAIQSAAIQTTNDKVALSWTVL